MLLHRRLERMPRPVEQAIGIHIWGISHSPSGQLRTPHFAGQVEHGHVPEIARNLLSQSGRSGGDPVLNRNSQGVTAS